MPPPLAGQRFALAEGRQLEELVVLLEKAGAVALRYPLISILDPDDPTPVQAWLGRAIVGEFTHLVFLTGEGFTRLSEQADALGRQSAWFRAVANAVTITRGPKPVRAMKAHNLAPTHIADTPTSEGVAAVLSRVDLSAATVGVQLYKPELPEPLAVALGDRAATVLPYIYAPASDGERVGELIERMATGGTEGIVFTSSPQVERLFAVAIERHVEAQLRAGLVRVRVAAVGPVVEAELRGRGVRVDVVPERGFVMKNLVQQLGRNVIPSQ